MYARVVELNLPGGRQKIDIEFNNVRYTGRVGFYGPSKEILKGVNGKFKSGELTAIMGPSGAGKSSLLNILTGFERKNCKGNIDYICNEGKCQWQEYRKQACYIQQDDQLQPLFTTLEIMLLATELKIDKSLNRETKRMLVDDLLDSLDLSKTKETRCDRLSGGEKKRLSIALELIDNPPVMFLDEPTTGLDSLSSLQCISLLRNLAKSGRTIICTIHQPSATIFQLFDHIYLLANGKCMYQGAPQNTVPYFASLGFQCPIYHNPADYMLELVNKDYGNFEDKFAEAALKNEESYRLPCKLETDLEDGKSEKPNEEIPLIGRSGKTAVFINPPPEYIRFWILLKRIMLQLYRDWPLGHLRLLIHALVAVFLGMFYTDSGANGNRTINNVGYFFISIVYLCYTSMMPAVFKLPSELPVLRKERFNNWYQLRTYYVALLISSIPVQAMFAFFYTCISYFLTNQPPELNRFLMFLGIAILSNLISDTFGLLLGTLINPVNGTFIGAITTAAMLLFSGFLVLFKHMPSFMFYISYLSYMRYAVHGLVLAIYGFERDKLPCPEDVNYCHYRLPELLLDEFGMTEGSYWKDIIILLSCFAFLRIIAYCTLKRKLVTT